MVCSFHPCGVMYGMIISGQNILKSAVAVVVNCRYVHVELFNEFFCESLHNMWTTVMARIVCHAYCGRVFCSQGFLIVTVHVNLSIPSTQVVSHRRPTLKTARGIRRTLSSATFSSDPPATIYSQLLFCSLVTYMRRV